MNTLTLIRGLPGSGKSTLARAIVLGSEEFNTPIHYEADMYHLNEQGKYEYKPENVKASHEWCRERTRISLEAGFNVIVSNTFTQKWEMKPYIDMANELGVKLQIITGKADFGNVHNVPEGVLNLMAERWED